VTGSSSTVRRSRSDRVTIVQPQIKVTTMTPMISEFLRLRLGWAGAGRQVGVEPASRRLPGGAYGGRVGAVDRGRAGLGHDVGGGCSDGEAMGCTAGGSGCCVGCSHGNGAGGCSTGSVVGGDGYQSGSGGGE
jgi:hypothetical protein